MSYYNGISDEELIAEGWTDAQIAELRRVEAKEIERRKKEHEDAMRKFREEYDALTPNQKKAYANLVQMGAPASIIMREARHLGAKQDQADNERAIRLMNKKWWQFWIK